MPHPYPQLDTVELSQVATEGLLHGPPRPVHVSFPLDAAGPAATPAIAAWRWVIESSLRRDLAGRALGWELVVRRDGHELLDACEGYVRAPWEATSPGVEAAPDRRTFIASMSKPITATALQAAIEDWNVLLGKLEELGRELGLWPLRHPGSLGSGRGTDFAQIAATATGVSRGLVLRVLANPHRLSVDTPLLTALPTIRGADASVAAITLRNLLVHESGIDKDAAPNMPAFDDAQNPFDLIGWIDQVLAMPLSWQPGSGQPGYWNGHFVILRGVVEYLVDGDYVAYAQRRVLRPAGATNSSCTNDEPDRALYYHAASATSGAGRGGDWGSCTQTAGAWGWYASPRELCRFLEAVNEGVILEQATATAMLSQGLGWMGLHGTEGDYHGHNGGWGWNGVGMNGCMGILPDGTTAALVVNSDGVEATGVFQRALEAPLPQIVAPPRYVHANVVIVNPIGLGDLVYTTDGGDPAASSTPYPSGGFPLAGPATVKAAVFDGGSLLAGPVSVDVGYGTGDTRPAETGTQGTQGLDYAYLEGSFTATLPIESVATGTTAAPDTTPARRNDDYALVYTGAIAASADGEYTFATTSDDGSRLWIGDALLVDNDGMHGSKKVTSAPIRLQAGRHPLRIAFVQRGGGAQLDVTWSGPGFTEEPLPATALSTS